MNFQKCNQIDPNSLQSKVMGFFWFVLGKILEFEKLLTTI
jgi:hypothetical protein